ncbi:FecR family protein [Chitinophaga cymbidii]|uniref:Anti-sigma factor n=1 Tax=Chitinophaga cymbidii TaxID=1096750 RepID=A0A512RKE4_9BACT|nr:FecR domain-containing protein [Chitinophaga cymbidii]GEP96140.1 anti-sigma factor [Chitinophaga cymbidii]
MALLPENSEMDYNVLMNVLNGQATPEESAFVEEWVQRSDANRELYFRVKDILDLEKAGDRQLDVEARWQEVSAQLPGRRRVQWWKYAAMIAVLMLAGGTALYFGLRQAAPEVRMTVQHDAPVQISVLPDSTRVWLKGGSTLSYRPTFGEKDREIWITGTAYFDVQKATLPFVVHTKQLDVTVLGTAFTMHENAVILQQGKVKALAGQEEMTVQPGERVLVAAGGLKKEKVNAQLFGAWRDGDYNFENTSLAEIKEVLVSNYGYDVEIVNPGAFAGAAISGRVIMENEKALMDVLSAMLNASIEKTGNKLSIQPK